jgi:hypothetical protein
MAIVVVIATMPTALAGYVVFNFPDVLPPVAPPPLGPSVSDNLVVDDFRFSPNCHYDRGASLSPGIGWDNAGCGGGNQPNYLGPLPPPSNTALYVDYSGDLFYFVSVRTLGGGSQSEPYTVVSSNGGHETLGPAGDYFFSGPEWSNVEWIMFYYGDHGAPSAGFDQIVFIVPEPSALATLAPYVGAMLSLVSLRGRRRR